MSNLMEKIADTVNSLGVKRSFGDPVSIEGVEMVPVSLVYFGFGGGSGGDESGQGDGGGGAGGGASVPLGVYVSGFDGPRFQPNLIALLAVAIPLTWVSGKALARVIRALKK